MQREVQGVSLREVRFLDRGSKLPTHQLGSLTEMRGTQLSPKRMHHDLFARLTEQSYNISWYYM